mmetsp:Transcript_93156/g.221596  ORF Transcript_93156/g.221596 Transcript_93156/m.221596 type:complete len:309 (+) Transcript_93156:74-1000(+)
MVSSRSADGRDGQAGSVGSAGGGSMGMMGAASASPPGSANGSKQRKGKSRRKNVSEDDQEEDWSGGSDESSHSRRRRRRRDRERERRGRRSGRSKAQEKERSRTPVRLPEVDRFIDENHINSEAALKIRALSPEGQRKVISRPLTGDVQNPSKVMIARVRELQNQNEKSKSAGSGGADFSLWGGAMLGAPPEAVTKYIEDNDLDESAARSLRALPPHNQAIAIRWDLSQYKNPSAKFMSMAAALGNTPPPRMPMPPMYGMPPLAGPGGVPAMYSMPPPGMGPPGMVPSMYSMPPPGMGPMMGMMPPGR